MDYLSTVRVLDTDYKLRDEEAARINHTHKVAEIEDFPSDMPTPEKLIPSGGTTGQVLAKSSVTDYDVSWADPVSVKFSDSADVERISGNDYKLVASSGAASSYPVGSLYINANDSTNPATLLGFGTWERFGEGRMILSASSAHSAGETGGSETVTLTTDQIPPHSHTALFHNARVEAAGYGLTKAAGFKDRVTVDGRGKDTESTGGGKAHDNMPPYISVYVWVRTA